MRTDTPKTIYLKDYKPYPYEIKSVELNFELQEKYTFVTSIIEFNKKNDCTDDLFLNGEDLEIEHILLNNKSTKNYSKNSQGLTLPCPEDTTFTLEIKTKIYPEQNTRLEGLYKSGGNFCTQCEAEGFRRITYFPDRPDVMTTYTVRLEADKESYPILLSNGNKVDDGELSNNRHFTIWHDPHPKPCYLFALVAGNLNHIHDIYTTSSGRDVDLFIYVRPGDENQCDHAMESLKKSMKWDEDVYGLEYDLDIFNIVAVSDFNMGAMENKSLNIFNTALVLAHQETATDQDFLRVESVIAHEYFHNWSGNRITCRDWFQLSLKEGLTVFRDQEFSADLNSRDVQRIDDVSHLRKLQFAEDSGPLAHPIRPDNYIEINNFYTMTIYEKGAEVIRMIRTILGAKEYRKATYLYFSRHDGGAATCDDWIKCMEDASGKDFSQFKLWYSQAGTPTIHFRGEYLSDKKQYLVSLKQELPETPGQKNKEPMHIPVALGLLNNAGIDLIDTQVLHLTEQSQEFTFENIEASPTPSILRGFSAPVKLKTNLSPKDLEFLSQNDTDGFNQWESGHILDKNVLHRITDEIESEQKPQIENSVLNYYGQKIQSALQSDSDNALMARSLTLPDVTSISLERTLSNPVTINKARNMLLAAIKREHKGALEKLYKQCTNDGDFSLEPDAMGRRALRNVVLSILTCTNGTGCAKKAKEHYETANNMTDRMAALISIVSNKNPERNEVFEDFYNRYSSYELVIDKWFAAQAGAVRDDIIQQLNDLRNHKDFNIKNPNRVRSLYAAYAMNNPASFHAEDGSGYSFLCDAIIDLNTINPQIAARLLTPMRDWRRYTKDRQNKMTSGLERILKTTNLSPDVFEIASKSLKR